MYCRSLLILYLTGPHSCQNAAVSHDSVAAEQDPGHPGQQGRQGGQQAVGGGEASSQQGGAQHAAPPRLPPVRHHHLHRRGLHTSDQRDEEIRCTHLDLFPGGCSVQQDPLHQAGVGEGQDNLAVPYLSICRLRDRLGMKTEVDLDKVVEYLLQI